MTFPQLFCIPTFNNVHRFDQFRADFCSIYKWRKLNLLELNIKNCKHITVLDEVKIILDLGVLSDHRLSCRDNISMIVNKVCGILGYMKRWFKVFIDLYLTKILFISLVRSILVYGSMGALSQCKNALSLLFVCYFEAHFMARLRNSFNHN